MIAIILNTAPSYLKLKFCNFYMFIINEEIKFLFKGTTFLFIYEPLIFAVGIWLVVCGQPLISLLAKMEVLKSWACADSI